MDAQIREAERRGDQAEVRRLKRRAGAVVQVGDTIRCVQAHVSVVQQLVGKRGQVIQVVPVPRYDIRVVFPAYKWNWTGRGGGSGPWDDGGPDLGWWLQAGEYEVIE